MSDRELMVALTPHSLPLSNLLRLKADHSLGVVVIGHCARENHAVFVSHNANSFGIDNAVGIGGFVNPQGAADRHHQVVAVVGRS